MMMLFYCMTFPNLFPHSPVDGHLLYLQTLCQGVKTDLSVSLGAKRDSLAGKWSESSILSRGVLELQCTWKHCGTGVLRTDSTSGMFPTLLLSLSESWTGEEPWRTWEQTALASNSLRVKRELFAVVGNISCLIHGGLRDRGRCSPSSWGEASNAVNFLPGGLEGASYGLTFVTTNQFFLVSNNVAMIMSPCVHVQELRRVYT